MTRRPLLALALAFALAGCGRREAVRAAAPASPPPPPPAEVRGLLPSPSPLTPAAPAPAADGAHAALEVTGEFVSPMRSEVAARFPGRVGQVLVDEGARIRSGQPLLVMETEYLELEAARAEAELMRARAAQEDARREFERKQGLLGKQSVSQAVFDRAQAAHDQAQAAVQSAQAARDLAKQRLADATITSPVNGVVVERRADVGEHLGDSTVAFVVAQTAPLKLRFKLPERYLATTREGLPVKASVEPYPGESFTGKVKVVAGAVDPATRAFTVEAEFPNRDGRLKPGLFARVELGR